MIWKRKDYKKMAELAFTPYNLKNLLNPLHNIVSLLKVDTKLFFLIIRSVKGFKT